MNPLGFNKEKKKDKLGFSEFTPKYYLLERVGECC